MYVLGAATGGTHQMISQMPDLTATGRRGVRARRRSRMAGIKPDDVDLLMGYDRFTITALLHLEDLGFCAKGEGGAFVEDGKLGPGGVAADEHQRRRPLATRTPACTACSCSSRRCASCAARRATARSPTAEVAVAHGSGGVLSTMGTVVLGTEATL